MRIVAELLDAGQPGVLDRVRLSDVERTLDEAAVLLGIDEDKILMLLMDHAMIYKTGFRELTG